MASPHIRLDRLNRISLARQHGQKRLGDIRRVPGTVMLERGFFLFDRLYQNGLFQPLAQRDIGGDMAKETLVETSFAGYGFNPLEFAIGDRISQIRT